MELLTHSFIAIGIILSIVQLSVSHPRAVINGNKIHGRTVIISGKKVSEFLGIRYAKPPVDGLRFQKPIPSSSNLKSFMAINPPPCCWQTSEYPWPWYDGNSPRSEDCLFLNIWTPKSAGGNNRKAVIFWLPDGGFRFGNIQMPEYYGGPLSGLGDVVVVTANFRQGPFGFLTSGTNDAPGNVALYDVLEALRWVNQNIEAFGGDTSRITISGEASGSYAAALLSVSPLAKGLFRRQIIVSASPAAPDSSNFEKNLNISQELAERLHCANKTFTIRDHPSQVVKCMKHLPAALISEMHAHILPKSTATFYPQFGDDLLPSSPHQSIVNKNMKCVEALIGDVHDEGSYMLTAGNPRMFGFFGEKKPRINKTLGENLIRGLFPTFQDQQVLVDHYLGDTNDTDYGAIRRQVYTSAGDAHLLCPVVYYAESCAAQGGNVYYYLLNRRPSDSPWAKWMGVAHVSHAEFVAGLPLRRPNNFKKQEEKISRGLIEIWSSFAKNGKPSIPWPLYSKENPEVVYLGPKSVPNGKGTGPHRQNCDFFRPYYGF